MEIFSSAEPRFAGRRFDRGRGVLVDSCDAEVDLRPQSLAVFQIQSDRAGELVNKNEIVEAVWQDVSVTDDSLTQCVHDIRVALGDTRHQVLRTVSRRGYVLEPDKNIHARLPAMTQISAALVLSVAALTLSIVALLLTAI